MKHQPYKAFFFLIDKLVRYTKGSNILMTIKLSTTNSVNKTLQHKALWDLQTPYVDVWDSRGCSYEGVSAPLTQQRALAVK